MNKRKLALMTAILCLSASAVWAGGGTQENPSQLTNGIWTELNYQNKGDTENWTSFSVTSGVPYYIWWHDYDTDSSLLDVKVDASYKDGPSIFTGADFGSPLSFTSDRNGTVLVRAYKMNNDDRGGFRVGFSTTRQQPQLSPDSSSYHPGGQANPTPLVDSKPVINAFTFATTGGEFWYSFNVVNGGIYVVDWADWDIDDSLLDILIDVSYKNGPRIFTALDGDSEEVDAWFISDRNGTVLIRVYPYESFILGSFILAYWEE
ncbi:MAG: hypothetical protein LBQ94_02765 [Treponema sp.]|jgi:hypothetical protein|nr:hypothetical protein [Treponema sp.]